MPIKESNNACVLQIFVAEIFHASQRVRKLNAQKVPTHIVSS